MSYNVLDSFTPTTPLRITYNSRLLLAGAELKPSAVVNKPRVDVGGTDLRVFYTLVSSLLAGQELMFYERPEPRSGIHRMVFVLFRQLGRGAVFAPDMRHNFNCRNFARQYHLDIVAATYFNCQREAGSGGRRFRPERSEGTI
ncbi:protein HEADING DATE 3A-like [Phragmites australis]|uniref:protein HEADING DATE 3A-like n=1 Tax=Phragmites australis TaxID=29695 RepID=UPI002D787C53|nr:protein HEADING DATE 3A-like [Phragmites australis]